MPLTRCRSPLLAHSLLIPALAWISPGEFRGADTPPSRDLGTRVDSTPLAQTENVEDMVLRIQRELDELESLPDPEERLKGAASLSAKIEGVQATDPGNPWLLYLHGRLNVLVGRTGEGRDQLRKFIETREGRNEWTAYRVLGDLFSTEFPRLAEAQYVKARELRGDDADILLGLSVCRMKLADVEGAARYADEAVQADGRKNAAPLSQRALVLAARKAWVPAEESAKAALALAEEALMREPGRRSLVRQVETQSQRLCDILRAYLAQAPRDFDAALRLEQYERHRWDVLALLSRFEAVDLLETALAAAGDSPPVKLRERYAAVLIEVGRSAEARRQYEEILRTDPAHEHAKQMLEKLSDR